MIVDRSGNTWVEDNDGYTLFGFDETNKVVTWFSSSKWKIKEFKDIVFGDDK